MAAGTVGGALLVVPLKQSEFGRRRSRLDQSELNSALAAQVHRLIADHSTTALSSGAETVPFRPARLSKQLRLSI